MGGALGAVFQFEGSGEISGLMPRTKIIRSSSEKSVGRSLISSFSHPLPPAAGRFAVASFPFTPTVIVGGETESFTETVGAKVDICDSVVDRLFSYPDCSSGPFIRRLDD